MCSESPYPPPYVKLNDQGNLRLPPNRGQIPRYQSDNQVSGGKRCLKCVCCCYCIFTVLPFVLGTSILLFILNLPYYPSYILDHIAVKAFDFQKNSSLYAEFSVTVEAKNPNVYMGYIYGEGCSVDVLYGGTTLCSGKIPAFYQPGNNITVIDIVLKGKSEISSGRQESLAQNQKKNEIPLLVMVKTPITPVFLGHSLKQFFFNVNGSIDVDNLSPNNKIGILSSRYSNSFSYNF